MLAQGSVFSAHAEVVPGILDEYDLGMSILRARGGSSSNALRIAVPAMYSPRTRR